MPGALRKKCTPKGASGDRPEHKTVQTRHDKTKTKKQKNKKREAKPKHLLSSE